MSNLQIAILDPTAGRPPKRRRSIPLSLRLFVSINLLFGISGTLWFGIPAYRQYGALHGISRPNVAISSNQVG